MRKTIAAGLLLPAVILTSGEPKTAYAEPDGWQDSFVYATDNTTKIPLPTRFKADFDDQFLTLVCEMKDPNADALSKLAAGKRGEWPLCDSVEVFFDPSRTCGKYFQIAAGVNGALYDSRWKKNIETNWTAEIKIEKDGWNVTFRIPFSDAGMQKAKIGDIWGFNICRNVKNPQTGDYFSTWAHVGSAFHRPERFGLLIFGSPSAAEKGRNTQIRKNLDLLTQELKQKGFYGEFENRIRQLEKRCTEPDIRDIREELLLMEKLKGM